MLSSSSNLVFVNIILLYIILLTVKKSFRRQKVRSDIFVCVYNTNAQTMENHWHACSIETADYHLCLCMRKYDAQRDITKTETNKKTPKNTKTN